LVAHRAGFGSDAPSALPDFRPAELGKAGGNSVYLGNRPQITSSEREPAAHTRLQITAASSLHRVGGRTSAAPLLGEHRDHDGNEALSREGAARRFTADLLCPEMLVGGQAKPTLACERNDRVRNFAARAVARSRRILPH